MEITTLIEDRPGRPGLAHEFGLSLHIHTPEMNLLLDTGQTGAFLDNATALGLDLEKLDMALISHGHYDHGGGLGPFMDAFPKVPVYLHKWAMGQFYGNIGARLSPEMNKWIPNAIKSLPPFRRYIGLPREVLDRQGQNFRLVNRPWQVRENLFLITYIPKTHPIPQGNRYLLFKEGQRLKPDGFVHEIMLVVREADGLTLFSGCCHGGILNMVDTLKTRFPNDPIKAVVGGFHLNHESPDTVAHIGKTLAAHDIPRIITGHCTGQTGQEILAEQLGDRLEALTPGSVHTF